MSPALNGSSALQCFECSNAIEIRNGIMFDFYPGMPHIEMCNIMYYMHMYYICISFYFPMYTYSLEWDEILWRDIGDEEAIALADLRVFKNFKKLK